MAKKSDDEKYKDRINKILSSASMKKYVSDASVSLGEDEVSVGDIEPIVTRFPSLNLMIGIGGLPKGKIVEISGEEGCYKSALSWAIAGDVQRSGKLVAWVDAENAVDLRIPKVRKFLERLKVDFNSIILIRPDTAEMAFQIIQTLAKNDEIGLIVFDSIVALSNIREEKADLTKEDRNTLPMTINRGLRRCAKILSTTDCTLILINQLRENMDRKGPYDKKWKTTGGKGLKHWCSLRLFAYKQKIKNADKEVIGNAVTYGVEKTRFDNPRDNATMFYYNQHGFDIGEELFELAVTWGILERSGNSYVYYKNSKTKKSRVEWIKYLNENPKSFDKILEEVTIQYEEYYSDDTEDDVDDDYDEADDEGGDDDDENNDENDDDEDE